MIEQVLSLKKRYDKMVAAFTQEEFTGWFLEFFKLYPFMTKVQWVQFTPYFNDGEPCVFSVCDPELELSPSYIATHPGLGLGTADYQIKDYDVVLTEEEEESERFITCCTIDKKANPELSEAMKAVQGLFEVEDILKSVFGDHAEVIVTPEKIVCQVYEHD